jgi:hypothetical protein
MTVAFYKLSNVIPFDKAEKMLREDVVKMFGDKG